MKYFLGLIFCCSSIFTLGQDYGNDPDRAIDSLLTIIKTRQEDTTKVKHLNALSFQYKYGGEYDKSLHYANAALKLSEKINFKEGIYRSYLNIGLSYSYWGKYDQALENLFVSLKIAEQMDDKSAMALSYGNIGGIYNSKDQYEKGLENFLIALRISEEIGDRVRTADNLICIGQVYEYKGDYDKALENYGVSLNIMEEIKDKEGIGEVYNNIGLIYQKKMKRAGPDLRLGFYQKALENFSASLKIMEEIGNKQASAYAYGNITILYQDIGNYRKALEHYSVLLKMFQEIGDSISVGIVYNNLGNLYYSQNKITEAKNNQLLALGIAKEIGSKEQMMHVYLSLSLCDSAAGNYKEAFGYYKLYHESKDLLFNAESDEKIAEMSALYESDKKEAQIELLEKDKEKQAAVAVAESRKQQVIIWSVVTGLLLVIIFSVFMYNRWRVTKKQKHVIELQKNEVTKQKEIVEEQKHLVEAHQKEITDSIKYARRIQQAILPPKEFIEKHLPENFVLFQPKDIVAGDFYWMEESGDTIFIAAADCTGHGVPGAMVSVVCSNALNRAVKEFGLLDPGKILDKTTDLVEETFEKSGEQIKDGMDISLLAYNKTTGEIQWSGAHNALWYISNAALKEIKADKQPIGKFENRKPFTSHKIEYSPNSIFYLFTDGLPDQFGGSKGKKFMYKQFKENLIAGSILSMREQEQNLEKNFNEWKGNLEQVDDVTVIGIKL